MQCERHSLPGVVSAVLPSACGGPCKFYLYVEESLKMRSATKMKQNLASKSSFKVTRTTERNSGTKRKGINSWAKDVSTGACLYLCASVSLCGCVYLCVRPCYVCVCVCLYVSVYCLTYWREKTCLGEQADEGCLGRVSIWAGPWRKNNARTVMTDILIRGIEERN